MQVGIPRVLSFFYYYPFYKEFLERLGLSAVLSNPTSTRTLENLALCPTDEPCISVKLAFPHTAELVERGVERLFLPTLVSSDSSSYYCPKHIGLPAMLRNGLKLPPEILISPKIDWRSSPRRSLDALVEAGIKLGATAARARSALREAWRFQNRFQRAAVEKGLTYPEALERLAGVRVRRREKPYNPRACFRPDLRVGVVAHNYVLYDYIAHDLVERLKEHARVLVPEMVPRETWRRTLAEVPYGRELWSFEQVLVGCALHWLRRRLVDCLILLGPFECGPEAVIEVFLEEEADKQGIPLLILTVDEQSGEAGLVTRLEAFLDTVTPAAGSPVVGAAIEGGPGNPPNPTAAFPPRLVVPPLPEGRVLGFPTLGKLGAALATVFNGEGARAVGPLPITRRTAELGEELAPEFMCYPLAVTLGQMRECLEAGANTLVMVGGKGRCRLGWYAELQEILLKKAGYDFDMLIINSPLPLRQNWHEFTAVIHKMLGGQPWRRTAQRALLGYAKAAAAERAEKVLYELRAREKRRGEADAFFRRLEKSLWEAATFGSLRSAWREFARQCRCVPLDEGPPPYRVRLIGEIYAVFENYVNHDLPRLLGSLAEVRILVETEITVLNWFRYNILHAPAAVRRHRQIARAAAPYLGEMVGGHGLDSVGLSALAAEEGVDGVVHLWPFTCMPEIIAQSILTRVAEDKELPLLTVIVNEQSGEAGLRTRVESFAHILRERRVRGEV